MRFDFNVWRLSLPAILLLSGCALAPGLDIQDNSLANGWGLGAHDQVKTVAITGELIAEQLRYEAGKGHDSSSDRVTGVLPEDEYRVSAHDVLQITVWNHPELTNPAGELGIGGVQASVASPSGRLVRSDGTIFYPYVGVVHVADETVEEIRQILTTRLKGYIESPQVDVSVAKFRGQLVYVTGEVLKPGVYPISDQGMTVLDAVNEAGGAFHQGGASTNSSASLSFTPDLEHVTVTRHGHVRNINLRALLKRGDVSQNIRLQAGDIVHVPNNYRNKVFVLGEVGKQTALVITEGRMSLTEAISEAGGFDQETSNPAKVFVIRGTLTANALKAKQLAIYRLDASSADAILLADEFELKSRDIVYVSTAEVVRWGRVLNQLSGTIQAVNLGLAATRR